MALAVVRCGAPARHAATRIQALLHDGVAKHLVAFKPHLKLLDVPFYARELAEPMALWLIPWLHLHGVDKDAADVPTLTAVLVKSYLDKRDK